MATEKQKAAEKAAKEKAATTGVEAAAEKAAEEKKAATMNGLRVISKRDNWRRAGRTWTGTSECLADAFTAEQLKQLRGDAMLVVQDIQLNADDLGQSE